MVPLATPREDPATAPLAPFTIIRTETVLSRLPLHTLAKTGRVHINITQKNTDGDITLHWDVSYSDKYGPARQLAYKLDTIVINRRLEDYPRPLPHVIRLGSLTDLAHQCHLGRHTNRVKKALLQNAAAFITALVRYRATDGTERTLEAGFTRYSVVFTGEQLPDGTHADAVYLDQRAHLNRTGRFYILPGYTCNKLSRRFGVTYRR